MRNIIIAALLASGSLVATDAVQANNLGSFSEKNIDGEAIYKKQCSVCHGEKAKKSPKTGIAALAGRDATRLALTIRAYRDQDKDVGTYTMHKNSVIMKNETDKLSDMHISALAKYISGLK